MTAQPNHSWCNTCHGAFTEDVCPSCKPPTFKTCGGCGRMLLNQTNGSTFCVPCADKLFPRKHEPVMNRIVTGKGSLRDFARMIKRFKDQPQFQHHPLCRTLSSKYKKAYMCNCHLSGKVISDDALIKSGHNKQEAVK